MPEGTKFIFKIEYSLSRSLGAIAASQTTVRVAYEELQSNRDSDFRDFVFPLFPKAILFYFYFTPLQLVLCCAAAWKVSPYIIIVQVIFSLLWDHWAHPGYFENQISLKPVLAGICSLANYSVAYEETQSNRVYDFRDFVCSLFPKANPFLLLFYNVRWYDMCMYFRPCTVKAAATGEGWT